MKNNLSMLGACVGLLLGTLTARPALAIQGCTLRDPDRDVRRLFPEATDYRTHLVSLRERDPALHPLLAQRLGEALDPVYEDPGMPYSYYQVLRGQEVIGWVFGVNQRGQFGGMQLILATTPAGEVKAFYYQKLSSPHRRDLMSESFTSKFKGLRLGDFYLHQGYRQLGQQRPEDRVAAIAPPVDSDLVREDVAATRRGVMKNLILFDLIWRNDSQKNVYGQVQQIVREQRGEAAERVPAASSGGR